MQKIKNLWPVLVALVLLSGVFVAAGCSISSEQIEQAKQVAIEVRDAADKAIADTEAALLHVPDGPEKEKLIEVLEKARKVRDEADNALQQLDAAVESVQDGTLEPGVVQLLSRLPYGPYIVAVLAVGLSVWQEWQKRRATASLVRVVDSWERVVGYNLSSAQKDAVRAIQGEDVTARVHAIKEKLRNDL